MYNFTSCACVLVGVLKGGAKEVGVPGTARFRGRQYSQIWVWAYFAHHRLIKFVRLFGPGLFVDGLRPLARHRKRILFAAPDTFCRFSPHFWSDHISL